MSRSLGLHLVMSVFLTCWALNFRNKFLKKQIKVELTHLLIKQRSTNVSANWAQFSTRQRPRPTPSVPLYCICLKVGDASDYLLGQEHPSFFLPAGWNEDILAGDPAVILNHARGTMEVEGRLHGESNEAQGRGSLTPLSLQTHCLQTSRTQHRNKLPS